MYFTLTAHRNWTSQFQMLKSYMWLGAIRWGIGQPPIEVVLRPRDQDPQI